MKYDFETVVNRKNSGSVKWDDMYHFNPDIDGDIVPFSVADMELKTAPEIIEGLSQYIASSVLGYTKPSKDYMNAVCGWMERRHNWKIDPEWIIVYPGVVPAFFDAVKIFARPGEGVIVMSPVYHPFYFAIKNNGSKIVNNPLVINGNSYEIDFKDLEEKAKDPNNKILLFCSPHNPVGRVWTKKELERIAEICLRNDILIVSDEIHHDLIMPGYRHTAFATLSKEVADKMIICTAPSKTFNLAGLSTSNIIIPNKKIRDEYIGKGPKNMINCVGLKACEIAYNRCEEWLGQLTGLIYRNHLELKKFIGENMPGIKAFDLEGTYLQWLDFRSMGLDKDELEKFLNLKARVFFSQGYIFGEEGIGFERMNIACPAGTMMKALKRLSDLLKK